MRKLLGAAVLAAAIVSCKADQLDIPNPNSASVSGATSDPTALQLLATGLFSEQRGTRSGMITNAGIFGRESYTFSPQDGRFTTHPLIGIMVNGVQKIDPTGFAVGPWGGEYGLLRDIYNFKNTVNGIATLTDAQKAGAIGFAQTLEAMMLFDIVATHDTLGGIVEMKADPKELAPFVSRDSMYKYILGTLDASATNLAAAGSSFPVKLPPGFAGFDKPATFAKFTQAIKAKVEAYWATSGGGTAAWQDCLTALQASFLNPSASTRAQFDVGVYDTYGPSPDSPNGLTQATNTQLYAHMSFQSDVELKTNGDPDDRYTAKIRTGLSPASGPPNSNGPVSATSTLGFSIWPTVSSSIPIIRNEELILIRAEAELATGNKAGAITDINQVRVNSGGLPPTTLTAASPDDDILMGILYEKRYSLMMEGDRWFDMRRYNKLDLLPLDVASGPNKNFVARVNPIPQSECLVRAGQTGDLIGPNGQNDCAP